MEKKIKDFTELEVWKLAHQLRIDVYKFTNFLPREEKFNRVDQLKKAVSSIPSNITEGYG